MRRWLETLGRDLGYAVRSFRRSPSFVLVALLSLTLGIGATSAIFSVIYGVLIAPYPYAKPGEIWAPEVRARDGRGGHGYTLDEFRALTELPAFADVMATSMETVLMTGDFAPESFNGVLLSGNAFNFLGVPPVIGRTIQPTDIRPDGQVEPVVVLSHKLWLRLFEGSPTAIGGTLRLNNRPHTIVGVMPPRFGWYGSEGFWLPLSPDRTDLPFIAPIVRLAPGVSQAVAEEQLSALNNRLALEKPATFPAQGFTTTLRNYLDVTVASGEMRNQPAAAARRGRVPAAHRLRQRRQLAAGARDRARAGDGGPHVDWRRTPPADASAPHGKRAALPRRRNPGCPVRLRRDPLDRGPHARVLRAERVACHDQHSRAAVFARRLGDDRNCLWPRAGAADVEG